MYFAPFFLFHPPFWLDLDAVAFIQYRYFVSSDAKQYINTEPILMWRKSMFPTEDSSVSNHDAAPATEAQHHFTNTDYAAELLKTQDLFSAF
jgi:hypothetical protein